MAATAFLATTPAARGQALDVSPVSLTLVAGQRSATLNITNRGDQKTSIQTRPFVWEQTDGSDRLAPTKEIAVSPPLFELGPGETQLVRLVIRAPASATETAYRLLLDQVPGPAAAGTIRVALRISLPVFVRPPAPAAAALTWRIERKGPEVTLVCQNDGGRHARILRLAFSDLPAGAGLDQQGMAYVLAHARQRWRMKDATRRLTAGLEVRFAAETDEGRVDATATVVDTP